VKVIDRKFKDYKSEARVEIDLLIAMGYNVEDILQISKHMVNIIEPCALKVAEKRARITLNE